jgi:hypothetical protein
MQWSPLIWIGQSTKRMIFFSFQADSNYGEQGFMAFEVKVSSTDPHHEGDLVGLIQNITFSKRVATYAGSGTLTALPAPESNPFVDGKSAFAPGTAQPLQTMILGMATNFLLLTNREIRKEPLRFHRKVARNSECQRRPMVLKVQWALRVWKWRNISLFICTTRPPVKISNSGVVLRL